jgi:hypothetical protein
MVFGFNRGAASTPPPASDDETKLLVTDLDDEGWVSVSMDTTQQTENAVQDNCRSGQQGTTECCGQDYEKGEWPPCSPDKLPFAFVLGADGPAPR